MHLVICLIIPARVERTIPRLTYSSKVQFQAFSLLSSLQHNAHQVASRSRVECLAGCCGGAAVHP